MYCGTFSAVTSVSGIPKWFLPPKPTGYTTNGTFNTYCIAEPSAGSATVEINGSIEWDYKDQVPNP